MYLQCTFQKATLDVLSASLAPDATCLNEYFSNEDRNVMDTKVAETVVSSAESDRGGLNLKVRAT